MNKKEGREREATRGGAEGKEEKNADEKEKPKMTG